MKKYTEVGGGGEGENGEERNGTVNTLTYTGNLELVILVCGWCLSFQESKMLSKVLFPRISGKGPNYVRTCNGTSF